MESNLTVAYRLLEELKKENIPHATEECVTARSSFKVGGIAALAVYPKSAEQLIGALRILHRHGLRYEVLGNCSNVIFAFERFEGALIFTDGICELSVEGQRIKAACGRSLTGLAATAAAHSLSGLEFAYGIPALVGGAVYMNAGAYGGEIASVLEYSLAYDCDSDSVIRLDENSFGYRHSVYMERPLICLEAGFALRTGNESEIRALMRRNMDARAEKQPLDLPSAGSYFKRPVGHFAGKLIEDCGLKGMRIGGAQVSEKHAGFIVNAGGATADDILALEEKIKEIVMSRYGVELQREVRLIR